MAKTMTPKEVALEWGQSPKTVRKFLRQDESLGSLAPGKGGRWALPAQKVKGARKRFDTWKAAEAAKRAEALASAQSAQDDAIEEEVLEDDEALDDLDAPESDDDEEVLEDE